MFQLSGFPCMVSEPRLQNATGTGPLGEWLLVFAGLLISGLEVSRFADAASGLSA